MKIIQLDASQWRSATDFYRAILPAIGAPDWHSGNVNALVDTMIWGDFNALKPPYKIQVHSIESLPAAVMQEIDWAEEDLTKAREDFKLRRGSDVDVTFDVTFEVIGR